MGWAIHGWIRCRWGSVCVLSNRSGWIVRVWLLMLLHMNRTLFMESVNTNPQLAHTSIDCLIYALLPHRRLIPGRSVQPSFHLRPTERSLKLVERPCSLVGGFESTGILPSCSPFRSTSCNSTCPSDIKFSMVACLLNICTNSRVTPAGMSKLIYEGDD